MHWRWSCLLLAVLPLCAWAQRPPLEIPDDPATVIEHLPQGYAALAPRPRQAATSLARIQALLGTAASSGDARLVARAEALLAQLPAADERPEVLLARAYAAQYRHDFSGARSLLDQLLQQHPRHADARLARAQLLLVQGDLQHARADCAALALGVDSERGSLCVAALSLRRGEYAAAATVLDRWLARGDRQDKGLRRYALVMRAEAASGAGAPDADVWFKRALVLAPDDVRTLAAYARHLRAAGRPAQVLALLADAPATEHLLLERALAAQSAGLPDAWVLADTLQRRYQTARAIGSEPDLRDEARYLLTLRGDAAAALELAQRNFASQRDREDVWLLRRAAAAAGQPQALQSLQAWARSQQLQLPPLDEGDR